jgi:hypothetical protein
MRAKYKTSWLLFHPTKTSNHWTRRWIRNKFRALSSSDVLWTRTILVEWSWKFSFARWASPMTSRTRRCDLFVATPHFLWWHDRKRCTIIINERAAQRASSCCCLLLAADIMRCVSPFVRTSSLSHMSFCVRRTVPFLEKKTGGNPQKVQDDPTPESCYWNEYFRKFLLEIFVRGRTVYSS